MITEQKFPRSLLAVLCSTTILYTCLILSLVGVSAYHTTLLLLGKYDWWFQRSLEHIFFFPWIYIATLALVGGGVAFIHFLWKTVFESCRPIAFGWAIWSDDGSHRQVFSPFLPPTFDTFSGRVRSLLSEVEVIFPESRVTTVRVVIGCNCSIQTVDRQTCLTLGVVALLMFTPAEVLAVIAHEYGHLQEEESLAEHESRILTSSLADRLALGYEDQRAYWRSFRRHPGGSPFLYRYGFSKVQEAAQKFFFFYSQYLMKRSLTPSPQGGTSLIECEFRCDQHATRVVEPTILATALIRINDISVGYRLYGEELCQSTQNNEYELLCRFRKVVDMYSVSKLDAVVKERSELLDIETSTHPSSRKRIERLLGCRHLPDLAIDEPRFLNEEEASELSKWIRHNNQNISSYQSRCIARTWESADNLQGFSLPVTGMQFCSEQKKWPADRSINSGTATSDRANQFQRPRKREIALALWVNFLIIWVLGGVYMTLSLLGGFQVPFNFLAAMLLPILLIYHCKGISSQGQCWGERRLGIRLICQSGGAPGFCRGVLVRSWAYWLTASILLFLIPEVGLLLLVVELVLFLRGQSSLRDRLTKTQYVCFKRY